MTGETELESLRAELEAERKRARELAERNSLLEKSVMRPVEESAIKRLGAYLARFLDENEFGQVDVMLNSAVLELATITAERDKLLRNFQAVCANRDFYRDMAVQHQLRMARLEAELNHYKQLNDESRKQEPAFGKLLAAAPEAPKGEVA